MHTQILDVDHAGVAQTSVVDGDVLRIGNSRAVTALSDAQTVCRYTADLSDHVVEVITRSIEGNGELLREHADGFT